MRGLPLAGRRGRALTRRSKEWPTGRPPERNHRATFHLGLAFAGVYLGLAALTVAYPSYMLAHDRVHAELSAVPLVLAGMPWSLLVIELVALVHRPSEGRFLSLP